MNLTKFRDSKAASASRATIPNAKKDATGRSSMRTNRHLARAVSETADARQEILTAAESAFADHRASRIIREAGATMIIATQPILPFTECSTNGTLMSSCLT